MKIVFHKHFKKRFKKVPKKIQEQFYNRLDLFMENMSHTVLNVHRLEGSYNECFSINITGDYRAIFKKDLSVVTFILIGTHSELY